MGTGPYVPYRTPPVAGEAPRYPLPGTNPPAAPQYPPQVPAVPVPQTPAPAPNAAPPTYPLAPGAQPQPPAADPTAAQPKGEAGLFEPGQIVAVVGNEYILYGDVLPTLNQYLEPAYAKAKSRAEIEQIDAMRDKLAKQIVDQMVTNKLMYLEYIRQIEKNAGKAASEAKIKINEAVREKFDAELIATQAKVANATPDEIQTMMKNDPYIPRLALMMKENNLLLPADLDNFLRKSGSSLEKQRRAWGEFNIGRLSISQNVNLKPEVSHQEMIDYYREHADEFAVQAKAKFEILSVRFDRFPSKEAAWQAIAAMGNEVFFGAPLATVAKRSSHDPNAEKGGQYDWTTKGSLASEVIDQAIFTLEVGKLSQILEDDRGFHIVRVTERTEAGQVPFVEAQTKIKEAIINEKKNKEFKAFAMRLKDKTPVWTIYDEPTEVAGRPAATTNLAPR